ncbi:MAG: hypothetical protein B7Z66_07835 [Chromatiales bacterium 21-64-14]|nr:MAG: hypothetical protein B7Z66_07835 [Chromatiales bacterium 21-64-14]HQU15965.1 molybdopterin-dependent oxidoreductase [Gammaproteobacteria bacterium]
MPEHRAEGVQGFTARRGFLKVLGGSAALALLSGCFDEFRALGFKPTVEKHTPFITPNDDFYLVAVDPAYRPAFQLQDIGQHWSLELQGRSGATGHIGYDDLNARARHTVLYTFECIGNPVGGPLIGNARWRVVPLKEMLARAPGGIGTARSVMFEALDGFYSSVSIERALDDYAFLALQMNGTPLPPGHGFPVRAILPDLYGMKQPRWLKRIRLLEESATTSYWEKRGWAGEVPVKTMSRFDPRRHAKATQPLALTGVAFGGRRGIRSVEVSLDDGANWIPCQLVTGTQPGVWSLWRYVWNTPVPGRHSLRVRATDTTGALQIARYQDSFPDGASGYDQLVLDLSA